jgi:hypothetical protein
VSPVDLSWMFKSTLSTNALLCASVPLTKLTGMSRASVDDIFPSKKKLLSKEPTLTHLNFFPPLPYFKIQRVPWTEEVNLFSTSCIDRQRYNKIVQLQTSSKYHCFYFPILIIITQRFSYTSHDDLAHLFLDSIANRKASSTFPNRKR